MELGKTLLQAYPFLHRKMIYFPYKVQSRLLAKIEEGSFIGLVVNKGTAPACYIACTDPTYNFTTKDILELQKQPHGGYTYGGHLIDYPYLTKKEQELYWFGWDYAHYGDFNGIHIDFGPELNQGTKKWATIELINETKDLIKYYNDIKRKDN